MAVISTRSRYGLRLLIDLAERPLGETVDLHSIATRQAIPEKYLSKLAASLLGAGLLRSARGPKGGYALAKAPEDIDIYTIVEVLEGRLSLLECSQDGGACDRSPYCAARSLWSGLEEAIRGYLEAKTLATVAAAHGQPEYFI